MNNAQKVIKYVAIAFAIVLIVGIVTSILTAVGAIFGISTLIDMVNNNVEVESFTKEYVNIQNIQIDVTATNLEIMSADETNVNILKIEGIDIPTEYKFEEDNRTLKIKGKKVKADSKLIIYLPSAAHDLDIDVGAGNIQMENINIQSLELDTGATNANITNLTVTSDANIDAGAGDITIESSNISNLDIDAGVGNLEYTGYLNGTNDIDCGVGNVELNLEGTESMYKITAEKGIGELKINGSKLSGTQILGSGTNIVKLSGGIGSLSINY